MLILAFDTATPAVTVALHDGDQVVAEESAVDARRHGELLSAFIDKALRSAGADPGRPDRHRGRVPAPAPTPACGPAWSPRGCSARTLGLPVDGDLHPGHDRRQRGRGRRRPRVSRRHRRPPQGAVLGQVLGLRAAGHRARRSARPPTCPPGCRWRARARGSTPSWSSRRSSRRYPAAAQLAALAAETDRGRDARRRRRAALPASARCPGAGPAEAGDPVTTPRRPRPSCGR